MSNYNDIKIISEIDEDRTYLTPPVPEQDSRVMQGLKIQSADRDELSDKMSDMRLKSFNNQSNLYYQPFNPNVIDLENRLNRNQVWKRNEFKDTINNRINNCHNSQLVQSQPTQIITQKQQFQHQSNMQSQYNDRMFYNNYNQTNKIKIKDRNNDRMSNYTPLSSNSHPDYCVNQNQYNTNQKFIDNRLGNSSNNFLDDNGNIKYNVRRAEKFINNHQCGIENCFGGGCYHNSSTISEEEYKFVNQDIPASNIMTIGRLPESNQSSRINFKDKANQRLQNLISLPKTSSLPVVPIYQPKQKNLWQQSQQNTHKMKQRINELHQNCNVVVNDMMPINTQLLDD
jgi:hypothetical protein